MSVHTRATRMFGKTRVTIVWNGKHYTATVCKPGRKPETYLFGPLPKRFNFLPNEAMPSTSQHAAP